jgi:hypothetical protein
VPARRGGVTEGGGWAEEKKGQIGFLSPSALPFLLKYYPSTLLSTQRVLNTCLLS